MAGVLLRTGEQRTNQLTRLGGYKVGRLKLSQRRPYGMQSAPNEVQSSHYDGSDP